MALPPSGKARGLCHKHRTGFRVLWPTERHLESRALASACGNTPTPQRGLDSNAPAPPGGRIRGMILFAFTNSFFTHSRRQRMDRQHPFCIADPAAVQRFLRDSVLNFRSITLRCVLENDSGQTACLLTKIERLIMLRFAALDHWIRITRLTTSGS